MFDSKIQKGIEYCIGRDHDCNSCPYNTDENGIILNADECKQNLYGDLMLYIEDCENVIKLLEEKNE